ncbi:hypothetical protein KJD10_05020 (plasmid) [Borreliella valaisiana]|uniref:hypothetical protein n=1 Tax=Borreliella valaisiana TaxID=62088 RepID=UPI00273805C0|nr:hypothetical protein [Borreliella valaisiana]WLN25772.1 hypothetical protein KJD10_05020 [Borreliella valaisiana]
MGNKIFYISVVFSILIISCDWETTKNKSTKITELLNKREEEPENQEGENLGKNSMSKNGIPTIDVDTVNLESLNVNLNNLPQQVDNPIIPHWEAIAPEVRAEVEPMDNINVAAITLKPDLEDSSSSATIGGVEEILPIKPQKEPNKTTLPSKLEDLKSFLKTTHEKEAFKEAENTQAKLSNSNIGERIVKSHKEYENLSSLFWNIQNKLHTQNDLLRKDIDFKKDREKYKVMSRSFSYIEKKIKDLHLTLDEIQRNFQIADSNWGNANSLLKESTEKLILAIEKRYDNESRNQGQIGGSANWQDINLADNFAKDAKHNAEDSMNNLENAAHYFQYSCSGKKEAQRILEEIQKKFSQMGI